MTQHLTVSTVAAAALKAHAEGRLAAQHLTNPRDGCTYRSPEGYVCAVGAALDDETLARLEERPELMTKTLRVLVMYEVLIVDEEILPTLNRLQDAHDNWVKGTDTEARFLDLAKRLAEQ